MQNEIRYFSMFSGVGGFELGLQNKNSNSIQTSIKNGLQGFSDKSLPNGEIKENRCKYSFNCIGFSEIDKYSIQTYQKNFPNHINFGDATKIDPTKLPDFDMLCGGFPCQAFSIAGKRRGFDDTRGTMFFEVARILEVKRPKIVFLENVKGLLNHEKGKTFSVILQTLDELGYDVQWMVLNSKFFGVPQNRERVFIIGSLRGERRPEILPFGESGECYVSKNQTSSTITSSYRKGCNNHNQLIQLNQPTHSNNRIYGEEGISPSLNTAQGGNRQPKIQPAQLVNINRAKKPYNPNNREMKIKFRNDETSYTVKSATHEFMVKENMKIRRLTPIECERLQGFPDNWTEGVSDTQRYKQMGNAVTVNVIAAIGAHFHRTNKEKTN